MRAAAQAAIAAVDALEAEEEAADADLADEEECLSLFGGSSDGHSMDEGEEEGLAAPEAAEQQEAVLDVSSMNVPQLKQLLAARGASTGGNKAALQERLKAAVAATAAATGELEAAPEAAPTAAKGGRGGGRGRGRAGRGARGKGGGKGGDEGAPLPEVIRGTSYTYTCTVRSMPGLCSMISKRLDSKVYVFSERLPSLTIISGRGDRFWSVRTLSANFCIWGPPPEKRTKQPVRRRWPRSIRSSAPDDSYG